MKRTDHPTQDFQNGSQDIPANHKTETYDITLSASHVQKFETSSGASNIKVENTLQVKEESNILDTKMDIDDISLSDARGDDMMNIDPPSNQQTIPNEHELNMNELFSIKLQNRIHASI